MKYFFKGAAVTAVILIVLIGINVFCNMHDIHLDSTTTGAVSSACAVLLYHGLTRNEKNKEL